MGSTSLKNSFIPFVWYLRISRQWWMVQGHRKVCIGSILESQSACVPNEYIFRYFWLVLNGSSLFKTVWPILAQSGQSLKNWPSQVGARFPNPMLQALNWEMIFLKPESETQSLGLNQQLEEDGLGPFIANVVTHVWSRTLTIAA